MSQEPGALRVAGGGMRDTGEMGAATGVETEGVEE